MPIAALVGPGNGLPLARHKFLSTRSKRVPRKPLPRLRPG